MPVTITLALAQQQSFDLRCGTNSRRVDWKEVESLTDAADRDYFGITHAHDPLWTPSVPQLTALGRRLYQWLDGPEAWLRAGLTNRETTLLLDLVPALQAQDLNPDTAPLVRKLAHLPWELLHDGHAFLAERRIQPIRLMESRPATAQTATRPLRLLFMATSPEDVLPILDYEREEATILEATRQQPIDLVVEESGSVSQLQNLVASFAQDYFDIFHITGHGQIQNGTPLFVTEDEQGAAQRTTAGQLAESFGHRWPRLLFLSGCHTAQSLNRGAIPSMAHALVTAGADAVLGWARPVYDSTGIFAATHLYRALASGATPLEAVADVRREMLRAFLQHPDQPLCSDWHLLRIYQGVRETPALVTPLKTPKREQIKRKPPEPDFLDAEGRTKVAGASDFYGRRRQLQRCLKALAHPGDHYGVYLHGIGGYGKSTIAARLCRRHEAQNPGFERVVLVGPVDEAGLRRRLVDKFGADPAVIEILNRPKIEFKHQLAEFFNTIEGKDRRLLLVLDDFEQNIPEANVADGSLRLVPDAWRTLEALCFALEESATASRLIVTCRYHSPKELPPNRLFVEGLSGMPPTDIGKKASALLSDVPKEQRNPKREEKIVKVADGNPRLLEWLMAPALRDLIEDAFLDRLAAEVSRFRENILAAKLLGALSEPERKLLARMTLFGLSVPIAVVAEMAHGAPAESAMSLGLLEKQVAYGEDLYRVTTVLEPLLGPALSEVEWAEARHRAVRSLHKVWWADTREKREPRALEVVRLAVAAGELELAVVAGDGIAKTYISRNRYLEAVDLCRVVLAAFDDYRILGTVARAEEVLGDTVSARSHYERALSGCSASDDQKKSGTLHNLAGLEAQQGNVERALQLWQQSLEIRERIEDVQGKAITLNQMAGVIAQQGDIERALQLWQQSLEIRERTGDVKGKSSTLHNMAFVIAQNGEIERALQLWQQCLEIDEGTGEVRGIAATLAQRAGVIAQQGEIDRALQFWQQSLEILEQVGDVKGKAVTLNNMAGVIAQQGDIERALQLWQQSLEIQERICDVHGKASTLANMAWAAHQSGDNARRDELYQHAARALGSARAYIDLSRVLVNLGDSAQQGRQIFAAQAAWLVVKVQVPADRSLWALGQLFNLVPQADLLEPLLAAAAMILIDTRGANHPQREKLREQAARLLAIAAVNAGIESEETFQQWYAENRLADSSHVFPRLLERLEQLIGDRWLFDRTPLQATP